MADYAIYGIHAYGTARYGRAPVSDFYLDRFTAEPEGYSQVRVTWGTPTGDWDKLRLVRGAYGFPTDEIDGTILVEPPSGGNYIDTSVTQLRFYYYTLFIRQSSDGSWARGADVVCLLPGNYGYPDQLYALVPQFLRDGDSLYTVSSGPDQGAGQLQTFLAVIGAECDRLRSELESLLWVEEPTMMSGGLLPLLAKQLGTSYEAELGMELNRKQLANIVHLYKVKGTEPGVEGAAYAFSGWSANASPEANLMLSNDDASFEYGVGRWSEHTNVYLSRQTIQGLLSTSGSGALVMTAAGAGTMEARLPAMGTVGGPVSLPLLLGGTVAKKYSAPPSLPLLLSGGPAQTFLASFYGAVVPDAATSNTGASLPLLIASTGGGQKFTFSGYFQPMTVVRNVFVRLFFFDAANNMLSQVDGSQVSEIDTATPVRATVSATAPPRARYVGFALVVVSAGAAEQHKVDALQFEVGTSATTWQPANGVKLVVLADRVNRCVNPSFEVDVTGWTPIGATLDRVSTITDVSGSWSGRVTASAGQRRAGIQTTAQVPVTPGRMMAFSAYWQTAVTPRSVISKVDWYGAGGQVISSVASDPQAQLPLLLLGSILAPLDATTWTRYPFVVMPPDGAVGALYSTYVQAASGNLATSEVHYVDAILIEQSATVNAYFDGSNSPLADFRWEGTIGLSRSHYYHRRAVRESRLRTRLPDFLPAGSTLRILDAQPL